MFANAKTPSAGRSATRFAIDSCTMTREMNEELLFAMLFFGFRRFVASLAGTAANNVFPSPNAGVAPNDGGGLTLPLGGVPAPGSLPSEPTPDRLPSLGCSAMLGDRGPDLVLAVVLSLYKNGADAFELRDTREMRVPAVAGRGTVARGLGLMTVTSEG